MGQEVSTYMEQVVTDMRAAYGDAWNINLRGESPVTDDKAWQVQVGISRQIFEPDHSLGLNLALECAATVRYVSKAATHGASLQAVDIANSLAAWLANNVDETTGVFPHDIEVAPEPVLIAVNGQMVNTGRYLAHIFWVVDLDRIDPDIEIEGYTVGHPARNRVDVQYFYEIEYSDGTKAVIRSGPTPPTVASIANARFVRVIKLADPDAVPATTDTEVHYPAISQFEVG